MAELESAEALSGDHVRPHPMTGGDERPDPHVAVFRWQAVGSDRPGAAPTPTPAIRRVSLSTRRGPCCGAAIQLARYPRQRPQGTVGRHDPSEVQRQLRWPDAMTVGAGKKLTHQTVEQRVSAGRMARTATPRSSHAAWTPPAARVDPVSVLQDQDASRVTELVPIRHARMLESPFAFFRGGPRSWRLIWHRRPVRASTSSSAATHTWPTSAASPHPTATLSSPSTTSTRHCPGPGSGT